MLELLRRRLVILDGAMGTMARRLPLDEASRGNLDVLNLTQPAIIADIHRRYLDAGADVISTNTFNSTAISQADHGLENRVTDLNLAAARLARTAADEATASTGSPRFVAGVLGPTHRSLGRQRVERDTAALATFEEVSAAYAKACDALVEGGVDALLVETVVDADNARAALAAIRAVLSRRHVDLPIIVSVVLDEAGHPLAGAPLESLWSAIRGSRPAVVGFNCLAARPSLRAPLAALARLAAADSALCLYPNAGLPDASGVHPLSPAQFADTMRTLALEGLLNLVGGCCGTTPEHIRALAGAVAGVGPRTYQGAGL